MPVPGLNHTHEEEFAFEVSTNTREESEEFLILINFKFLRKQVHKPKNLPKK